MLRLLRSFWDIALWRRHPGDLPSSPVLVAITAAAYLAVSWLQAWQLYGEPQSFVRGAADLVLTYAAFWVLLAFAGRQPRFNQVIAAVLGLGALLSLPMLVLVELREPANAHYFLALLVWVASLTMIVWYLFVLGHIVRAALETGLAAGMVFAVVFSVGSTAVLSRLFPSGAH